MMYINKYIRKLFSMYACVYCTIIYSIILVRVDTLSIVIVLNPFRLLQSLQYPIMQKFVRKSHEFDEWLSTISYLSLLFSISQGCNTHFGWSGYSQISFQLSLGWFSSQFLDELLHWIRYHSIHLVLHGHT